MQAIAAHPLLSSALSDAALQSQIAALRESLKNHRNRARKMWDACSQQPAEEQSRAALGQYTEKLLKGQMNEVYG